MLAEHAIACSLRVLTFPMRNQWLMSTPTLSTFSSSISSLLGFPYPSHSSAWWARLRVLCLCFWTVHSHRETEKVEVGDTLFDIWLAVKNSGNDIRQYGLYPLFRAVYCFILPVGTLIRCRPGMQLSFSTNYFHVLCWEAAGALTYPFALLESSVLPAHGHVPYRPGIH